MSKATADIDGMIREAEFQQRKIALQAQFEKNLAYFQETAPEIVETFNDYHPTRYQLQFIDNYWDLLDITTKAPIYKQNPEDYCRNIVDQYIRKPFCYRISLMPTVAFGSEKEAHIANINPMLGEIDQAVEQYPEPRKPPIDTGCRLLIVSGIGLGYHLLEFIQRTEICHLCIVEPDPDIIFAALHTIDWQTLCERFTGEDCSINLVLAQHPIDGAKQLKNHIESIGMFNAARTHIFTHLKNAPLKETTDLLLDQLRAKLAGLGYFDDERLGFSHSIENIRRDAALLDLHKNPLKDIENTPVFVVANGPSLDKSAAMLKQHQDRAVIISCGSTLGSLYEMGIRPDFHVEMERTRPQLEWIEATTSPEYRKDIILVALNTVHPDVFSFFERGAIVLKTDDLGSLYLLELLGRLAYNTHLDYSNPTVGNTGVALAAAFGFKNIYLVGLDLGFAESGQHHSNYSAHYRMKEEEIPSMNLRTADSDGNIKLPGNFGGDVTANFIFASARINIQNVLRKHGDIKCFNTSDGVLFEGAKPLAVDSIHLNDRDWTKSKWVNKLYKHHRLPCLRASIPSNEKIINYFSPTEALLLETKAVVTTPITTKAEGWTQLSEIQSLANALRKKSKYGSLHILVRGSVDAFLLTLARSLYIQGDDKEVCDIYNHAKRYFIAFIDRAAQSLQSEMFELDKRDRKLATKFK